MTRAFTAVVAALVVVLAAIHFTAGHGATAADKAAAPPVGVGRPSMESPQFNPIAVSGDRVFVANTPAGTVDVIDAKTRKVVTRVPVGVDPVCVAARPDGKEVWVANHVSDSVSVIDADAASPTFLHVVATVQEFDPKTKATTFDEPVGIAFAGNEKAYVALSSENQIAVIDVAGRRATKRLTIPAQEPRAVVVRGERLYVVPFESHNQTQLSGGAEDKIDGRLVTFDAYEHSVKNNNVLSLGHVVDVVKHPKVPDRDLFVFDTKTDTLVTTVEGLGTLLYGLAVDGQGSVFVAQTDARNDSNGRSGTKKHGLKEMENRAFLNRVTKVAFRDGKAEKPVFFDLEPLPPAQPKREDAQATADDGTLVATAAPRGHLDVVKYLLELGADPSGTNADGNTPLHAAAFLCREEVVRLLLGRGASLTARNNKEAPADVVSGEWNQGLADFYTGLGSALNITIDLKQIQSARPEMARMLREGGDKPKEPGARPDGPAPADWPQFRGPGGTGVVTGKALPPDTWAAKENVAWKYEVPGHGWSCPIVVGGKVFVTSCVTDAKVAAPKTGYYAPKDTKTHDGEHRWTVYCLDAATGQVLWEKVAHKGRPQHPIHVKASYASETPVSDGERVYAYFGNVGLFCYDLTGKQLWSKSWDVVPTQLDWGTGASPVLHEGRIYVVNDNEKASFIVALDKLTGKEVWKTDRNEKSNWATPFVWKTGQRAEIVTCGKGKVRSYDLNGKVLWEFGGMSSICVPSPVVAGDLLIISSGYEFGRPRPVFAVKPGATGDISLKRGETGNEFIVWSNDMAGAYHPTPLVLGDHLYVLYSTGFLACFEAKTGKPVYERQRLGGSFTASPWSYGGKIFCLGEEGTTYVVKAGEEFELLGKNVLGEVSLATPAVADGRLFLRTREALYCIRSAK